MTYLLLGCAAVSRIAAVRPCALWARVLSVLMNDDASPRPHATRTTSASHKRKPQKAISNFKFTPRLTRGAVPMRCHAPMPSRGCRALGRGARAQDFDLGGAGAWFHYCSGSYSCRVARLGWCFNTECGRKILTLGERVRVSLPGNYPMVFQHSPLCGPGA
jgi:hypothetical protein